jgi:hypothetical protein
MLDSESGTYPSAADATDVLSRAPSSRAGGRTRAAARELARAHRLAVAIALVVLVTVAMRLPSALTDPFWQDEVASARVVTQPSFGDMLARVRLAESTPPAWYALAWAGHQAGISLEGLRIASIVLSALLAALIVVVARRLLPLWAATVAGLLSAVGWQFVSHGNELRAYALYGLLALVFGVLVHDASVRPSRVRLVAIVLCVAVGILTHYLFVLPLLAALVWLAVSRSLPRAARLRVGGAAVLGLAAIAPWVGVLAEQYSAERFGWIDDFDPLKGLYLYGTIFDPGGPIYSSEPASFGIRQVAWLAVLPIVVAGAACLWRRGDEGRLYALLTVVPVAVAYVIWAGGPDIFNTRNLLPVAPFVVISIAALLAALPRPLAVAGSGAAVGLAVAATLTAPPLGPPADRIAQALVDQGWQRDDAVILIADFYGFRSPIGWYLPGRPFLQRIGLDADRGRVFLVVQGARSWAGLGRYRPPGAVQRIDYVFVVPVDEERRVETLVELGGALIRARD